MLGTTRTNFLNILNGHAAISPNMALRLEKVFGGTASHFVRLQTSYDLAKAQKELVNKTVQSTTEILIIFISKLTVN